LEVRGWDYSVEFGPDGTVEMYGVEVSGSDEMEPVRYPALGADFIGVFDARTAR
jgi:hypothetical protein